MDTKQKYEYKIYAAIIIGSKDDDDKLSDTLSDFGADGWRVIQTAATHDIYHGEDGKEYRQLLTVILERPALSGKTDS